MIYLTIPQLLKIKVSTFQLRVCTYVFIGIYILHVLHAYVWRHLIIFEKNPKSEITKSKEINILICMIKLPLRKMISITL